MQAASLDRQYQALADPTRRAILQQVWSQQKAAGEVAAEFEISRPAISRHLRVLRESGLVQVTSVGTSRFYRADLAALSSLRAHFESFWETGLRNLKRTVESDQRSKAKRR